MELYEWELKQRAFLYKITMLAYVHTLSCQLSSYGVQGQPGTLGSPKNILAQLRLEDPMAVRGQLWEAPITLAAIWVSEWVKHGINIHDQDQEYIL